jgi:hypothetical protein
MTIHREIGLSYHHKPIVQGVNYSPSWWIGRGGVGEGGEVARGDSGSDSPSDLPPVTSCSLCFVFFVFPRHLKQDWVAWPGVGPTPPSLFWASWHPSLTSCAPGSSHGKILTLQNPGSI